MSEEENIKHSLINKFEYLWDKIKIQRQRRLFAEVPKELFLDVFDFAVNKLKFSFLCTITGLDEGVNLSFIYHLAHKTGILLNLKISVPKEKPIIKTVTNYFPAADIYERELSGLLGAEVDGLPAGRRYPLPEDWPENQFPLRKDWKPETPMQETIPNKEEIK